MLSNAVGQEQGNAFSCIICHIRFHLQMVGMDMKKELYEYSDSYKYRRMRTLRYFSNDDLSEYVSFHSYQNTNVPFCVPKYGNVASAVGTVLCVLEKVFS